MQNDVVDYLNQRGIWLDGKLIRKADNMTLEAFFEEISAETNNPDFKAFCLDLLSHVVDSADSERLWCVFSATDAKGSKRSRLTFDAKAKEVGICANIKLQRFLKAGVQRRRKILGNKRSDPEHPHVEYLPYAELDCQSDAELVEASAEGAHEEVHEDAIAEDNVSDASSQADEGAIVTEMVAPSESDMATDSGSESL